MSRGHEGEFRPVTSLWSTLSFARVVASAFTRKVIARDANLVSQVSCWPVYFLLATSTAAREPMVLLGRPEGAPAARAGVVLTGPRMAGFADGLGYRRLSTATGVVVASCALGVLVSALIQVMGVCVVVACGALVVGLLGWGLWTVAKRTSKGMVLVSAAKTWAASQTPDGADAVVFASLLSAWPVGQGAGSALIDYMRSIPVDAVIVGVASTERTADFYVKAHHAKRNPDHDLITLWSLTAR